MQGSRRAFALGLPGSARDRLRLPGWFRGGGGAWRRGRDRDWDRDRDRVATSCQPLATSPIRHSERSEESQ